MENTKQPKACSDLCEASGKGPTFQPPLYVQRYGLVQKTMAFHNVKSVLDCGSAECKILAWLKTVPTLERLALLDLDEKLLRMNAGNTEPLIMERLIPHRSLELLVQVFAGDAGVLDCRVADYEAVSMVEIIEHLHDDVLERVTENIFGKMQPRVVVITTPNSNYNKLFPDHSGFRHWDHKFEWTQEEFENWCQGVCGHYGYSVEYTGVGEPPLECPECGFCSQAGIFTRQHEKSSVERGEESYTLISQAKFPAKVEKTKTAKVKEEVEYYINMLVADATYELPEEGECERFDDMGKILLQDIHRFNKVQQLCNMDELRDYLSTCYELSKDGTAVFIPIYGFEEEEEEDSTEDFDITEEQNCDQHFSSGTGDEDGNQVFQTECWDDDVS